MKLFLSAGGIKSAHLVLEDSVFNMSFFCETSDIKFSDPMQRADGLRVKSANVPVIFGAWSSYIKLLKTLVSQGF